MVLLEALAGEIVDENQRQNLISRSTEAGIWNRHIVDSAQLVCLARRPNGAWLDIGSGAGFPGLVIAALTNAHVLLVEPRKRRAEFLQRMIDRYFDQRVAVAGSRVEVAEMSQSTTNITARAFASIEEIFAVSQRFSAADTMWLLPRGKNAHAELEKASRAWHGVFHVEPSVTDPAAGIVVASGIRARSAR